MVPTPTDLTSASTALTPPRSEGAQAVVVLNPTQECQAYYFAPVVDLIPSYPTIWQTADLSGRRGTASLLS